VDIADWPTALDLVTEWACRGESRFVCLCNVHSLVSARTHPALADALGRADLVAPDGAPVAWMLRQLGAARQERLDGPQFMWRCLEQAQLHGIPVYFYGGASDTVARLLERVAASFPSLTIAGAWSPPFRALTEEEHSHDLARIAASGARLVFVGLGCPKQDLWMARHQHRIAATMVGVGAAFDFCSLRLRRAPPWMRRHALEWLHRLSQEPRRLGPRYLRTHPVFLYLAAAQWVATRLTGSRPAALSEGMRRGG
jgi:N-acetylglucosaminyldiphosphoundecaprenol N-acetyl-beta-D-mannosaminyltransferase